MKFLKEKPVEYKEILSVKEDMECLLEADHYISRKEYKPLLNNKAMEFFLVLQEQELLKPYCRKHHIKMKEMRKILEMYSSLEETINHHNNTFVVQELKKNKTYFNHILDPIDSKIKLDEDQLQVVLCDEDYSLVIAGAGAGKTTTVAAKVKYLVEKCHIDPSEILIVSFTNKAVNELKEKIQKDLEIPCPICTFHSVGYTILRKEENEKVGIATDGKLYTVLQNYFKDTILRDEQKMHQLVLFFSSYLDSSMIPYYTTMKSDLNQYKKEIIDARTKKKITIQNEIVRSRQEVEIANFLYLYNIDYEYEPMYPYYMNGSARPYTPDFKIKQGNKESYIEHFGISEEGKNNAYDEQTLTYYKKSINDKVLFHRAHQTDLIYTFSSYKDGRSLLEHLRVSLLQHGYILNRKKDEEVMKRILTIESDKYVDKLIRLLMRFISNFKVNGFTLEDFDRMKKSTTNVRTQLFLDICASCYLEYEKELHNSHCIDFQDMINESTKLLQECEKMKQKLNFKYIIVDEYQDISKQRFDLTLSLSKVTDAKIMAVGDDWQSIYAFSGSDITLFTEFEKKMGYAKCLKIRKTYRNAQEVIDIAGNFVQKNDTQIKKSLVSDKRIEDPVIIYTYDSSYKSKQNSGANYSLSCAIEEALGHIVKNNKRNQNILMLGRFGFEGYQLSKSGLFTYDVKKNQIISKKYPKCQITYMTAHASKGLGYDNVIVINGKNGTYGFPSQIEDDPVLNLVTKVDRSMEYAEERRLFYVALTRTKNRVYFIAPEQNPSQFLLELRKDYKNVVLQGRWQDNTVISNVKRVCPICGYPMQYRYKNAFGLRLFICTNEPEICDYMTNEYQAAPLSILKCPDCQDGYLVVRKGSEYFLGCTNWNKKGTGCNTTMNLNQYKRITFKKKERFL